MLPVTDRKCEERGAANGQGKEPNQQPLASVHGTDSNRWVNSTPGFSSLKGVTYRDLSSDDCFASLLASLLSAYTAQSMFSLCVSAFISSFLFLQTCLPPPHRTVNTLNLELRHCTRYHVRLYHVALWFPSLVDDAWFSCTFFILQQEKLQCLYRLVQVQCLCQPPLSQDVESRTEIRIFQNKQTDFPPAVWKLCESCVKVNRSTALYPYRTFQSYSSLTSSDRGEKKRTAGAVCFTPFALPPLGAAFRNHITRFPSWYEDGAHLEKHQL